MPTSGNPPADPTGARPASRLAFLRRPWWIGVIVTALAFAAACWTILAPWQFDRNTERQAQNAAIRAAIEAPTVAVTTYLSSAAPPPAGAIWHQVSITGTFEVTREVYARLRPDNAGHPAAEVVLPMRLDDGTVVIVDRGYVSDASVRAGQVPADPPAGRVTVIGRVQADQPDPLARPAVQENGLTQVYGIDSRTLALGEVVRQGFVQLVPGTPGVLDPIAVPQLDDGPFLSYAWQWCAFGAMALIAIGFFVYREATDPINGPESEQSPISEDPKVELPALQPAGSRGRLRRKEFDASELYD